MDALSHVQRCQTCRFWRESECRVNPPHPAYGWAETDPDDWCAEYMVNTSLLPRDEDDLMSGDDG